ncbi:hypothetical protein ASF49_03025 [Methylobacterium sp. Leaf104]|uniref:hypothetical protein n=1 Tax=Methylobacterium TaxID=407 RepID=UPI0006FEAF60|nr:MULTISPECIES: hypothetical protein [Methylobacterium]KQP42815.1 hypothetical protein ASF49_03025 [Methylobacterium sp. Leaf104]MCI9878599.1 hypothetical protein [Methylobacterium goesingense]
MDLEYSSLCFPRPDNCNRSPFRIGVDRALALSFPPPVGADLPDRMALALDALISALPSDREPDGGSGHP